MNRLIPLLLTCILATPSFSQDLTTEFGYEGRSPRIPYDFLTYERQVKQNGTWQDVNSIEQELDEQGNSLSQTFTGIDNKYYMEYAGKDFSVWHYGEDGLVDSVLYYMDSFNGQDSVLNWVVEYDHQAGEVVSRMRYFVDLFSAERSFLDGEQRTYDEQDRLRTYKGIHVNATDTNWVEFEYNAQGLFSGWNTARISELGDTHYVSSSEFTYNQDGLRTKSEFNYFFSGDTNVLVHSYSYANNKVDSIRYQSRNDGQWGSIGYDVLIYDDGRLDSILNIDNNQQDSSWVLRKKVAFTYNDRGQVVEEYNYQYYSVVSEYLHTWTYPEFPSGIGDVLERNVVAVYPNPTRDWISLESELPLEALQLLNMQGQVLLDANGLNGTRSRVDLSTLATGAYLLRVLDAEGNILSKPVIRH